MGDPSKRGALAELEIAASCLGTFLNGKRPHGGKRGLRGVKRVKVKLQSGVETAGGFGGLASKFRQFRQIRLLASLT